MSLKKGFLISLLITFSTIHAQFKTVDLIGTWESFKKETDVEIEPFTESPNSKSKEIKIDIVLKFSENNKMDFTMFGTPYKGTYSLKDSILTMGDRKYIITQLTKELLVLKDFDSLFGQKTHYKRSNTEIKTVKEYERVIEKYPSGKIKLRGRLHNGFDDGVWTEWYENGQKKSEKQYKDGIPLGVWKEWDKDGKLISEKKWN